MIWKFANAEENDFAEVDEEFNDAFTPYGVLFNKTGVCSSYAGDALSGRRRGWNVLL